MCAGKNTYSVEYASVIDASMQQPSVSAVEGRAFAGDGVFVGAGGCGESRMETGVFRFDTVHGDVGRQMRVERAADGVRIKFG